MSYTRDDAGVTTRLSPKLLDQVRGRLRLHHYSLRTEQAYVGWIRRFILANGKRHPGQMGKGEVEAFLTELATRGQVSGGTAVPVSRGSGRGVALDGESGARQAAAAHPVVLSAEEVARLLTMLEGSCRLMAGLLYGSGMRLLECLRLRIKDMDMVRGEIVVRDGKGGKDRRVPLPHSVRGELMQQRERALLLHAADLAKRAGRVFLPHALARKYLNADVEPGWQYLFPAARRSVDQRIGRVGRITYRKRSCSVRYRRHGARLALPARNTPDAAAFIRHASTGCRPRHPHVAGTARSQGRCHHTDLYACAGTRCIGGA
ncbi:integrase [Xanthomonas arboricola]